MAPMASPIRVVLAKKIATSWSLNSTCIRQIVVISTVAINLQDRHEDSRSCQMTCAHQMA